ncbi:MAG: energy transducer TonB [Casimicrobiaceae bacterium]
MSLPAPRLAPTHRRLWLSFGASALAHALALAILTGLLLPTPVWIRLGQPAALKVLLNEPQPAETAAPPLTLAEAAPPPPVIAPVTTSVPAPKPPEPLPEPPAPVLRSEPRPSAAPATGAQTPTEAMPDTVAEDAPLPPGDVAVGATDSAEVMGRTLALRLAQRFPERVGKAPQLQAPLMIPYPAQAARARREARIAALLIIDASGSVLETTLTPDDTLFGPTVQNALAGAKFRPADIDGKPAPYWVVLEFVFTMRPLRAPKRPPGG